MSKRIIKKLIENLSINRTNGTNHAKKTNSIRNHKRIFSAIPILTILIGALTLVSLLSVTSSALVANSVYALQPTHSASTSSKVSVNVSDIIAIRIMSLDGTTELDNLTLDLLPTPKGAFTSNSLSVETSTTNTTGYKLYIGAIGEDSSGTVTNALVNNDSSDGTSSTIPALSSSNVTEADYSKDNSPYKNSWGFSTNATTLTNTGTTENPVYTPVGNPDPSTITYNPVPALTDSTTAAIVRDNTTTAVEQELTPVTIGVNASSSLNAGTYTNTLEFTAVANPVPVDFSLSFNANTDGSGGSDGTVTNLPEGLTATAIASSYTFTLPDTTPARDGYRFLGWNTEANGTGDTYLAGSTYELLADDTDPYATTATLYALWSNSTLQFYTITTMQEMTNSICNTATTPLSTAEYKDTTGYYAGNTAYVPERTLIDTRDNNTYTIRKLADGNCWMTENLKLKLEAGKEIIASTNTGNTFSYTPQGTNSNDNANEAMNGNTVYSSETGQWYYNWYAATAGTGTTEQILKNTAVGSICPKGWRLPTVYSTEPVKSYGSLTNAYSITTDGTYSSGDYTAEMEAFPLNFVRYGGYANGELVSYADKGSYWSSTTGVLNSAYVLRYSSSVINPNDYYGRYYGYSLRCVNTSENIETPTFYNISTMQEMNSTVCGTATTPAASATDSSKVDSTGAYKGNTSYVPEKTLVDARDGNTYTVRKLADGNCWTTENLKLALEIGKPVTISSATSSETKTWTPEANPDPSNANNTVPMNSNTTKNSDNGLWYYNWYAATGNSGTPSMKSREEAPYSICPVNWRLPAHYNLSSTRSYGTLTNAYGITANGVEVYGEDYTAILESFPLNFSRLGNYDSGILVNTGYGRYWSSTAYLSADSAYFLSYNTYEVLPRYYNQKYTGSSLRCLAQ